MNNDRLDKIILNEEKNYDRKPAIIQTAYIKPNRNNEPYNLDKTFGILGEILCGCQCVEHCRCEDYCGCYDDPRDS